jgi:GTP pyrophosphokinase
VLRGRAPVPGRDLARLGAGGQLRAGGLETAQILAELRVDRDCLIAGLLYRAVREERLKLAHRRALRRAVAQLLRGVLRMAAISDLRNPSDRMCSGRRSAARQYPQDARGDGR